MPSRLPDVSSDAQPDLPNPDPIQLRFSSASFDPVNFLNENLSLPPLIGQQLASSPSKISHISVSASKIQELLAKLNAQNIRYSNSLTQLTDEILRSGSRLAYEVEILRGDANGLYEVLTDTLQEDIQTLILSDSAQRKAGTLASNEDSAAGFGGLLGSEEAKEGTRQDPEYITKLRMLVRVKTRLEDVINLFGEALEWPLPPSELSVASSLLSVSTPELGPENPSLEEKAQDVSKRFRAEILNLLDSEGGGQRGIEAAQRRVESLRLLAGLWKGTVEDKPRTRFVDSLSKMVDERKRILDAQFHPQHMRSESGTQRSSSVPGRPPPGQGRVERNVTESSNPAGGLFRNLQRLRDEIYLD